MGLGVAYKILKSHLAGGQLQSGSSIDIVMDQTLTQDATGTMAYLQFESLGLDHVRNELAVSYVDHNTVQVGFENADDHLYLQSVAAAKGIVFSKPGNGICHPPREIRHSRQDPHWFRFPYAHRRRYRDDSHRSRRSGCGPCYGRGSVLHNLSQGH